MHWTEKLCRHSALSITQHCCSSNFPPTKVCASLRLVLDSETFSPFIHGHQRPLSILTMAIIPTWQRISSKTSWSRKQSSLMFNPTLRVFSGMANQYADTWKHYANMSHVTQRPNQKCTLQMIRNPWSWAALTSFVAMYHKQILLQDSHA